MLKEARFLYRDDRKSKEELRKELVKTVENCMGNQKNTRNRSGRSHSPIIQSTPLSSYGRSYLNHANSPLETIISSLPVLLNETKEFKFQALEQNNELQHLRATLSEVQTTNQKLNLDF
jgi:hypothetical protein